ncbi:hypothetical protein A3D07_01640 [Candidatus Curtissbacteria bacterium RIFCSPHIGHO2_02_FULL_42_15]|uniref:SUF system FeS cluster assembly SufBD core domain-containing protein n=1 Tax=Candidatus Curtissbacteria bacterium RIFCSPHIGHO2_02_FULL_42_15 TaxID=1797716 RepID=A0A1F5GFM7_9BACT|nr:MAG: hypothetical protein A3D07_01640 [Candidatus Curtissbacteria bacterium RIFCSPHIGHO2_02_FULL_42_15]
MKVILRRNQKKLLPFELLEKDKRLDVILAEENAEVEIVGLVTGKGSEEKSLETYITHVAPNTRSNVNVRAVLRGKAKFDFRGTVKIEKGAKGADAYLRSDALLFDDAKMGDDTPALEILEPDVKAGHAATIGKVDEQMLFYLMTRGLSRSEAERLLIQGFVKPIKNILRANNTSREASTNVSSRLRSNNNSRPVRHRKHELAQAFRVGR